MLPSVKIVKFVKNCVPLQLSQSMLAGHMFPPMHCNVLCSKNHSVSDIVTYWAIWGLCLDQLEIKTRLYCSTMRNLSLKLMLFTGSFRMNIKSKTVCTGINFHKCCLFVGVLGSDCSDFLGPRGPLRTPLVSRPVVRNKNSRL